MERYDAPASLIVSVSTLVGEKEGARCCVAAREGFCYPDKK